MRVKNEKTKSQIMIFNEIWDQRYAFVVEYFEKYGNLDNIPYNYIKDGHNIFEFVMRNARDIEDECASLSAAEHRNKLIELGVTKDTYFKLLQKKQKAQKEQYRNKLLEGIGDHYKNNGTLDNLSEELQLLIMGKQYLESVGLLKEKEKQLLQAVGISFDAQSDEQRMKKLDRVTRNMDINVKKMYDKID